MSTKPLKSCPEAIRLRDAVALGKQIPLAVAIEDNGDLAAPYFLGQALASEPRLVRINCGDALTTDGSVSRKDRFTETLHYALYKQLRHMGNSKGYLGTCVELSSAGVDALYLSGWDRWADSLLEVAELLSAMRLAKSDSTIIGYRPCPIIVGVPATWLARIPQSEWPRELTGLIRIPKRVGSRLLI